MVFKILRAGRKVRALGRSLDDESEFRKYLEATAPKRGKHPLSEDIHLLQKDIDWLRFSREGKAYLQSMNEAPASPPAAKAPGMGFPFATIEDVLLDPAGWDGKNVIIDGKIELYSREKSGERWHIFSDGSSVVTAVSGKELSDGPGTLFAVARQTMHGKQVYLEALNFRPSMQPRE